MDSGSSGSMQSSSGGEEDYDSRAAAGFSGFLNNPPTGAHVGPIAMAKPNNPSPPAPAPAAPAPAPATHHPHSSFDPFSNLFDPLPFRSHQNSLLHLDSHWPRNPIQLPSASIPPSSSSSSSSQLPQSFMNNNTQLQATESNVVQAPRGLTLSTDPSDVVPNNTTNNPPLRNPRKRTRASRRAPTTVLTTDTSNFRAMVQEFTGIPAPPFTPVSSFPRARLDLFGGTSTSSAPPYLLRPFPQKLSNSPTTTTTTSATNSLLSPSSDFLLPKQNHLHHLPSMSSIFNLQTPPPPPLQQPNINLLVSLDTPRPTTDTNRNPHHLHQAPLPEELLSGNVTVRDTAGNILPASWGSGSGGGGASDQALRSVNGKYFTTGTKLNNNYSASSSLDFNGDKGSENVTTRTEGMIESWICSSD